MPEKVPLSDFCHNGKKAESSGKKGGIDPGGEVALKIRSGPFSFKWVASHIANKNGRMFQDIMKSGPFASWSHTHLFYDHDDDSSVLEDIVDYSLPFHSVLPGPIKKKVLDRLKRTFYSRAKVLRADLALHQNFAKKPKRILISGASGMLGSALIPLLTTGGHDVWRLVRRTPQKDKHELFWDPLQGKLKIFHILML